MKKALIGTALATSFLLSAPVTMADTNGYVGLDYQLFRLVDKSAKDPQPDGVALRVGGSLNDHFRVEGRLGRSVDSDEIDNGNYDVDRYVGMYVKAGATLANMVFPYVAFGFSKADLLSYEFQPKTSPFTNAAVIKNRNTESDFSWGVGADVMIGDFQLGAEWMMMMDKTDFELKTLSVSAAWRF